MEYLVQINPGASGFPQLALQGASSVFLCELGDFARNILTVLYVAF
jgi:hypothetical protein